MSLSSSRAGRAQGTAGQLASLQMLGSTGNCFQAHHIIRSSQHGFAMEKPPLPNLVTLSDGITGSVNEGRAWLLPPFTSIRHLAWSPVRFSH